MGTLGRSTRNRKKPASRRVGRTKQPHPAIAKLAVALKALKEALEQQAATAEILKVISSSPHDRGTVFEAILKSALRLCDAHLGLLNLREAHGLRTVAQRGGSAEFAAWVVERGIFKPDGGAIVQAVKTGRAFQVADALESADYRARKPKHTRFIDLGGVRTFLAVPLLKGREAIGNIGIYRREVRPFTDRQIALLQTFADQAVIAIENARLFNETKEVLERQTATAEVLRVISGSPTDVQPVFDAIAERAAVLCGARIGVVTKFDGELLHLVAFYGASPELVEPIRAIYPLRPGSDTTTARAVRDRAPAQIPDLLADPDYVPKQASLHAGYRSNVAVPLLREGRVIGAISVARAEIGAFSDKEIGLLQTFADQAVIAIENVRLFNETKEALEQQTATAEILRVISSSPTDMQPVFDSILEHAMRLCDAGLGTVGLYDGKTYRHRAQRGGSAEYMKRLFEEPFVPHADGTLGRMIAEGRPVHIPDYRELPAYRAREPRAVATVELGGARTYLAVPMLKDGRVLGGITIRRAEVRPFTQKQIDLLSTFASQAVIAIENVRLFKELQARTEALTKSVGQLTALGEVGQAISSTLDLETVLKTIVSRAVQLTGLDAGAVYEYEEVTEQFHLRAAENMSEEMIELLRRTPVRKGEGAVGGAAVAREPIQIPETHDESYRSQFREVLIRTGRRALLAVPLMREDHIIGALTVQRNTPGPFAPEVVELLKTFATQSAMAIQNARLFREIAEKSRQLEVASEHKSQFLASMSHELRTPLNALLGFNEMILGDVYGEVPADMRPPLAQMQSSGKHLLRLINNVLDLAKIEAGRMELALADYSVHDVVEGVRSTLQPLAAEKGLQFLAAVPADVPLAHGDCGRITQCLMNLAGNSLKFTKAGKVEISVAMNNGQLRYCVADTGIGIPRDKIGSLFTEFRQTDATVASEYGGTGLGLSISKKFVEMHGGRIWVESEPGRGSVFTFEVPLRAQRGAAAA
jgi:GAF domain-containing protein